MKDLWPSASRFWKDQARVRNGQQPYILTLSDPKTLSKRAHNPLLKEAGLTKPTAAVPWLGGDWYVWHAPDGFRARAATRTRMHASSARSWVS